MDAKTPTYANHAFRYDHYEDRDAEAPRATPPRRSQRPSDRRRSRKRTASLTVNGRRNRHWSR